MFQGARDNPGIYLFRDLAADYPFAFSDNPLDYYHTRAPTRCPTLYQGTTLSSMGRYLGLLGRPRTI